MADDTNEQLTNDERNWGMLSHIAAFAGLIIPIGNIIGPLVVWLMKRHESDFVGHHGKESLNFQISITMYLIVSALLTLILIGFFLLIAVFIADLVLIIIAAIRASNGEQYSYPFTIRFVQ